MNKYITCFLNRIYKSSKNSIFAFCGAVILGLTVHVTAWTNYFINHDSSYGLRTDINSIHALSEGKWFANFWILLRGPVMTSGNSIPLAILLIALSAAFIVKILKIKQGLWAVLVGGILVLIPSVYCAFSYQGFSFFFSMVMVVMAVFLSTKYKNRIANVFCIILLVLSIATYQAYIGFAAGLFLLQILVKILDGEETVKALYKEGGKYVLILLSAVLIYYLVLKLIIYYSGVNLSAYRGIKQMTQFNFSELPQVLFDTYAKVLNFFWFDSYGTQGIIVLLFRGTAMIGGFLLIRVSIFNKIHKNKLLFITEMLLIILFPFSIHAIAILGQNADTHWIMMYPFALLFILVIKLLDSYMGKKYWKKDFFIECIAVLLIIGILWDWGSTANQSYQRLRIAYENTYAKGTMLVHDIYSLDEYSSGMPVVFVQSPDATNIFSEEKGYFTYLDNFTGIVDSGRIMYKQYNISMFLRDFIGADFALANDEQTEAIMTMPLTHSMPSYPKSGSIEIVDNIVIVKLS